MDAELRGEATARRDPIEWFRELFDRAVATGMDDPNAMVLSSVDADGAPSSRVVLLKAFDASGFVFYTNTESRKGREILANPKVCLNFYWRELERQVRIRGQAEPVRPEEANAYFATRSRTSRLGAWASQQSRPLASRAELMERVAHYDDESRNVEVPRPPHWSGFRVVPDSIELWAAGEFRLHDRQVFEKRDGEWVVKRLYP
ncbi:MAG: pyridoxamine 5'-phosphate oxidase [Acidobacteriota bacterium]